jgi:hypothetical protein
MIEIISDDKILAMRARRNLAVLPGLTPISATMLDEAMLNSGSVN